MSDTEKRGCVTCVFRMLPPFGRAWCSARSFASLLPRGGGVSCTDWKPRTAPESKPAKPATEPTFGCADCTATDNDSCTHCDQGDAAKPATEPEAAKVECPECEGDTMRHSCAGCPFDGYRNKMDGFCEHDGDCQPCPACGGSGVKHG